MSRKKSKESEIGLQITQVGYIVNQQTTYIISTQECKKDNIDVMEA